MIRARVSGEGFDLERDLEEEFFPRAEKAMDRAADRMVQGIRQTLARTGEAQPGAPPAFRTGELSGSIERRPVRRRKNSVAADYGTALPQGGRLEFGGKDSKGRYIHPHPYVRPTEEREREEIEQILEDL